ncbi:hypothetical protein Hs30E_11810 [Lactococcus hodotermopsidis]|uniref:LysM domain-containing protein n=2 Tax=Pseudolactococcus hodotermopsidis TaxID=2709157 RepID=A0A6A0BB35_9LACT|nr:hypothetical protein Hs30E_11810 [Lactococcus hodotermopsidis]
MAGIVFVISAFLGNDDQLEADTQKKVAKPIKTESVTVNKIISSETPSSTVKIAEPVEKVQSEIESEEKDEVIYTVKEGDSLGLIAENHQVTILSIRQQNDLEVDEEIQPGQVLVFLRSYIVSDEDETEAIQESNGEISVDNGNKVAPGGLGEDERLYVLTQLQNLTGVDAREWDYIISRESGWIATIKNSSGGAYGLFQLLPTYPGYDGDIDAQIEGALYLFNYGGMSHWAL